MVMFGIATYSAYRIWVEIKARSDAAGVHCGEQYQSRCSPVRVEGLKKVNVTVNSATALSDVSHSEKKSLVPLFGR